MSGGSMDYLYRKVEDACIGNGTPMRRAFRKHLELVAKALHDIEWVDSCDYAKGGEEEAIRACLMPVEILSATLDEAVRVHGELGREIARAKETEA